MQHNYESQDGDRRNEEMQDATETAGTTSALPVPAIRRVHSYSGASSGESANEGLASRGQEMVARRTMSALEPTFNLVSSTSVGRSASMHAISSCATNTGTSTPFESGLVGPSIPLALRRASSDHQHIPGEVRDAATGGMQEKSGFRMGLDSPASFTTGWPTSSSLRMTTSGKTPTTPPKATTFNPGSPSNASTGLGMMTTPVRSSMALRARANSGTRMRGPGGTFGTPSIGVPSSETKKRSGSGSGNAPLAGPWHARANVRRLSRVLMLSSPSLPESVTATTASAIPPRDTRGRQGPPQFRNPFRRASSTCHLFQSRITANDTKAITQTSESRTDSRRRRKRIIRECGQRLRRSYNFSAAPVSGFHGFNDR